MDPSVELGYEHGCRCRRRSCCDVWHLVVQRGAREESGTARQAYTEYAGAPFLFFRKYELVANSSFSSSVGEGVPG